MFPGRTKKHFHAHACQELHCILHKHAADTFSLMRPGHRDGFYNPDHAFCGKQRMRGQAKTGGNFGGFQEQDDAKSNCLLILIVDDPAPVGWLQEGKGEFGCQVPLSQLLIRNGNDIIHIRVGGIGDRIMSGRQPGRFWPQKYNS